MKFEVGVDERGQRLDAWLCSKLAGMSRSRIQALIKAGCVRMNGRTGKRAHAKVAKRMQVEVTIPPVAPAELEGEDIPLDVIHEDESIIVINKPAGMVVHPAAGHSSGTLVNALLHHCKDLGGLGGEMRPGIVHRLDKDTSGVMVVAKNERAMNIIARQFKNSKVAKQYVAVVHGVPEPGNGRIETLIGRNRNDRKKMIVTRDSGRNAITNYTCEEKLGSFSLVRIRPETGRTHQIRVHMAHIGHPVAGDKQYGVRKNASCAECPERQMLHAEFLSFNHPEGGKRVEFKAPLPADMKRFVSRIRQSKGKES